MPVSTAEAEVIVLRPRLQRVPELLLPVSSLLRTRQAEIHAYIDGMLAEYDCGRVEASIASDPDLAALVGAYQKQARMVRCLFYRDAVPLPVLSRETRLLAPVRQAIKNLRGRLCDRYRGRL
jgi:hypothetical protein